MYLEETFKASLINWFDEHQRQMPWRETTNPYYIWVSEVMLQQTQVDTVRSYYQRFIEDFPTIEDLANADEDDVLKRWEGLGYYSRARNFHTAAKEVVEKYDGVVPKDPDAFLALKGVGPYTQAAVMSIAFDLPLATVDGNVFRVWSRLNDDAQDTALQKTRKAYEQDLLPYVQSQSGTFNQAMMELGALICSPTDPLCMFCPVMEHCEAYAKGTVLQRPVKTKKQKKTLHRLQVLYIEDEAGNMLLEQRDQSLLRGMWQFPMYPAETSHAEIEQEFDHHIIIDEDPSFQLKHQFTHRTWDITVYRAKVTDHHIGGNPFRHWIPCADKKRYTFPVPMTKIFNAMHQAD
ncbi:MULTISPECIES: A/G-specific adenine glycosylase [unclassified Staphylococcus]|uniref:A/G-specific adenine glycosylase n=1 Tax=unclassified Staphylococcus TaxID=91994 RepID=UPI0021D24BD1|nr:MULTISPECIES: A/G-specific adenine glycosylase [unclassified Staphylococcus]UXR68961.1 A/G-specific adenine glycosylase [Staphylococcus sp. IVB6246]UXR71019.1 A/G-specific adenine glycosylase [Staphylococcus sp. IVB6240]UXR75544.1 A/G-specific adenine glycosylase [Staphylococcus sp. IVB6233]UXR79746.1 A/G-specific adenine glycosylase [Staphylococcus sp. IVB6218]